MNTKHFARTIELLRDPNIDSFGPLAYELFAHYWEVPLEEARALIAETANLGSNDAVAARLMRYVKEKSAS